MWTELEILVQGDVITTYFWATQYGAKALVNTASVTFSGDPVIYDFPNLGYSVTLVLKGDTLFNRFENRNKNGEVTWTVDEVYER